MVELTIGFNTLRNYCRRTLLPTRNSVRPVFNAIIKLRLIAKVKGQVVTLPRIRDVPVRISSTARFFFCYEVHCSTQQISKTVVKETYFQEVLCSSSRRSTGYSTEIYFSATLDKLSVNAFRYTTNPPSLQLLCT